MTNKSKLLWRCRRGVKELDVVFTRFVDAKYDSLSTEHQAAFSQLLDIEDPIILGFMLGQTEPEEPKIREIVNLIKENVKD